MNQSESFYRQLHEKASREYDAFLDGLKRLPPDEIIEHSYEKVFKEDFLLALEYYDFTDDQAAALLSLEYPLDELYHEWLDADSSYMDLLQSCIEDRAALAIKDMNEKEHESEESTMARFDAMLENFEEVTLLDKPALFTSIRIDRNTVPEGYHLYEIRHDDEGRGDAVQIAKGILVNHWGSVITQEEIKLPPDGYLDIEPEDLNYDTGDCRNIQEFMSKYPLESKTPIMPDNITLPDMSIDAAERNAFGYNYDGMLPLHLERALELYDQDICVYLLYPDNSESMVNNRNEMENHDGIFGIEVENWQALQEFEQMKAAVKDSGASKEAMLLYGKDAAYGIYQLKDSDQTRDLRFESLEHLAAHGFSVDKDNYNLIYTAPLSNGDTLDKLYEKFNIDRPADFVGHSLSVSDIVVIRQDGNATAHYVDSFGFRELPDFYKENTQKTIDTAQAKHDTEQKPSIASRLQAEKKEGKKETTRPAHPHPCKIDVQER